MPYPIIPENLRAHQRIAVFGLGASGVAIANLLDAAGFAVVACDSREDVARDALSPGIELVTGRLELREATAVVLTPALHPLWPENIEKEELREALDLAAQDELELLSEIVLASGFFPGPVVAVCGTDGKSTTAALTHHLLQAAGAEPALGGNSWTPLSLVLAEETNARVAVAEVSAFQIWEPLRMEPDVAIVTNIADDHLDHFATREDYVHAKKLPLEHMTGGCAILNADDPILTEWRDELERRGVEVIGVRDTGRPATWESAAWCEGEGEGRELRVATRSLTITLRRDALVLDGAHNERNALAAIAATGRIIATLGLPFEPDELRELLEGALTSFRGLPHRLQPIADRDGVRWINDSKATNVHAACVALRSMSTPCVAIVGGVDKGLELEEWIELLKERCHTVICIGELRDRLAKSAGKRLKIHAMDTLEDAVELAARQARTGDSVLFSPGASSFDMFRSFEERGDRFAKAVDTTLSEQSPGA